MSASAGGAMDASGAADAEGGEGGAERAPRVAYLGPEGTFSQEALVAQVRDAPVEAVPVATIYDAVMAVQGGDVEWALVPIENSVEGSVSVTLDTLAREALDVRIAGEAVLAVRQCLIARDELDVAEIDTVVSHPHAAGQCAQLLRGELASARVLAATSTADAVRIVAQESQRTWAALGTRLAAQLYGCVVLREGVEDRHDNETRFVWLAGVAARGGLPPGRGDSGGDEALKTSLVFWPPGEDRPGWLVACLSEFAQRDVNLTRIESRPRREQLGRYMFFADIEGGPEEPAVAEAISGLRAQCEEVRLLGTYPAA